MSYWCEKCGRNVRHADIGAHWAGGCRGNLIPIATICDPPEPTVIEASDLAPGMVVAIADYYGNWTCTTDACLQNDGAVWAMRMDDTEDALWVAQGKTPC